MSRRIASINGLGDICRVDIQLLPVLVAELAKGAVELDRQARVGEPVDAGNLAVAANDEVGGSAIAKRNRNNIRDRQAALRRTRRQPGNELRGCVDAKVGGRHCRHVLHLDIDRGDRVTTALDQDVCRRRKDD
jgi:hypothetical protein